jgi:8-oxo-dGTP diphosphatase
VSQEQQGKHPSYTVDVVMLTPQEDQLALLVERTHVHEVWSLPWDIPSDQATLDGTANQIATLVTGTTPAWIEQVGAFGDHTNHPGSADISVAFVALVPLGTPAPDAGNFSWLKLDALPALSERQNIMVEYAVAAVRDRMDLSPVAFRLLPTSFTLSELQQMYELLLGKRLHKASFRRALQAAWLVEPTDEWRSEGRGRPAQLYRYAPKKRRKGRRGVRFDLLAP